MARQGRWRWLSRVRFYLFSWCLRILSRQLHRQ
jgi:hypothetical protein